MGKTEKVPEFGLDFIGLALADPRNVRNIGKSRITEALTFVRFFVSLQLLDKYWTLRSQMILFW